MAYLPPNAGRMNVTFGGNTAGAAATVSTGTLGLHGGNNVTLSQNGNNITFSGASIPAQTAYNFSNSNGVSFGTNGSTVTATVATTYAGSNHSHGNPTLNLTNLSGTTASASNGLTLSLSAAAQGLTSQSNQALSGSNGSFAFQTATFGSSNGMHFYTTNGSLVGSYTVPTQTNQTVGFYATGANTTGQSSSNTFDARSMSISAQGGLYAGMSGNTIHLSAATTYAASNHSHGNPTLNLTNISGTTASNSGGLTLSLSAAAPGAGGGAALSAGTQSVNTGTVNFANSNGVSFGMSGSNQITASVATTYAASNHSHGNPTLNLTNLSGTTASASNGLTLSLSASPQTVQTQNLHNVTLSGNTAGVMAHVSSGTLTLAGGNNITLSQNGNAVSIIGGAGGGGGGVALYDGINSITNGTAELSGNGAITASIDGQTVNLSVPAVSSLSATGAMSISTNGNTISIGPIPLVGSYFDNLVPQNSLQALTYTSVTGMTNRLLLQPLTPANELFPFNMTAGTMMLNFSNAGSSNQSGAHSSTWYVGIYTRVNSTQLSLLNSASVSYGMSANQSNSSSYQGHRWLTIHSSAFSTELSLSAGQRYFFGLMPRTSSISNYSSIQLAGMHVGWSVQRSGFMASASVSNTSMAWHPFMGVHTATTHTALPVSIANSHINKASAYANFIPQVIFDGGLAAM